jgi:hypothetical protein
MATDTIRFRLRHLFVLTAIVAILLAVMVSLWKWGNSVIMSVEIDAAKQSYNEGRITREQARQWVGDAVDQWPEKGK